MCVYRGVSGHWRCTVVVNWTYRVNNKSLIGALTLRYTAAAANWQGLFRFS